MTGDVLHRRGYSALGCRLRRLSERLDRDIRDVYQSKGHYFDPAWYPIVAALCDMGPLTASEAAEATGLSGASVSAIRGRLLAEGLIAVETDPRDLRRQRLIPTPKCQALTRELDSVWAAIGKAAQALCAESAPDLLMELEVIENALTRRRMSARVRALLTR